VKHKFLAVVDDDTILVEHLCELLSTAGVRQSGLSQRS
jgi:hypothetical protein